MRPLLIYIHGFKSSAESQKATEVRQYLQEQTLPIDFVAPTLSNYPDESFQQLLTLIKDEQLAGRKQIAMIGSSMGGFMATVIAERMKIKAALINPAVYPYKLISYFLGDNHNPYTNETFVLSDIHVQELKTLEVSSLTAKDYLFVLLQMGDESLDYRLAVDYYQGCRQLVEEGGDHRFQNFDRQLPAILEFLELT